jgi:succinate-acetate transporter protein
MLRPGKDKGLATPIPLGLATLAATTFCVGVGAIFQSSAAWAPYAMQALILGGLVELLAGMWAFAYGDALAATTFSFVGAFFGWWGLTQMGFLGIHATAAVVTNSMATVLVVAAVVVLYLWVASFYEFAAFNLTLLFLWIAFGLMGIAMYSGVEALTVIGGISAVISGLIGAYASFAAIYNATCLQDVVPLGESSEIRKRAENDELERIRRIHPNGGVHQEAGVHA